MLRLPPTRIALGERDLEWHSDRYEARLAQTLSKIRSSGLHAGIPSTMSPPTLDSPYPPITTDPSSDVDTVISPEPVPRSSRDYRDTVQANANTPHRTPLSLRDFMSRRCVQATGGEVRSQENLHMFEDLEDSQYEGTQVHSDDDPILEEPSGQSSETEFQQRSSPSLSVLHEVPDAEAIAEYSKVTSSAPGPSERPVARSRHYRLFFGLHRRRPRGRPKDLRQNRLDVSRDQDLDGSVDVNADHEQYTSGSSYVNPDIAIAEHSYRIPIHARTSPVSLPSGINRVETSRGIREPSIDLPPPPLYRLPDRLRNGSEVLPRSPLYVSHAAASSSPERPATSQQTVQINSSIEAGLLSLPPRRPERPMHHSQSRQYTHSESCKSTKHDLGSSTGSIRVRYEYKDTADSQNNIEAQKQAVRSQYWEPLSTYAMRSLSSNADSPSPPPLNIPRRRAFPSRQTSYRLFPPQVLPPRKLLLTPAFSTSPRFTSQNMYFHSSPPTRVVTQPLHLPTPSPNLANNNHSSPITCPPTSTSPHTPPQFMASQHNPRFTEPLLRNPPLRYHPNPLTPTHRPRSLRVYNDCFPAFSQPQTPIDLSRNGLHPSLTLGYVTAPVMHQSRPLSRVRGTGDVEDTPVRRSIRGWRAREEQAEQENSWIETEDEEREGAMWMGLDTTPPRRREWGAVMDMEMRMRMGRRFSDQA